MECEIVDADVNAVEGCCSRSRYVLNEGKVDDTGKPPAPEPAPIMGPDAPRVPAPAAEDKEPLAESVLNARLKNNDADFLGGGIRVDTPRLP